jgi:hypothetical protein
MCEEGEGRQRAIMFPRVLLLAKLLELGGEEALMAAKDNHPIYIHPLVEVLYPFQSFLIICPAVWRSFDGPRTIAVSLRVPRREVDFALQDQVQFMVWTIESADFSFPPVPLPQPTTIGTA